MGQVAVSSWQRLSQQFLTLLFPPTCAVCKRVGAVLCEDCVRTLPRLPEAVCGRCSRPVKRPFSLCAHCQKRPFPLQTIRATFHYVSPVKELIHKFKYENSFALAGPLGQAMAGAWLGQNVAATAVIPVPLHPKRYKKRGYNQSMLLAQQLCHYHPLPLMPDALQRVRFTRPQIELGADQRQQNMQQAFAATPHLVCGQHILLIDDVCTTGATLIACAEALLDGGAASVSAYCLARAVSKTQ